MLTRMSRGAQADSRLNFIFWSAAVWFVKNDDPIRITALVGKIR